VIKTLRIFCLLYFFINNAAYACNVNKVYVIGVQAIDYSPHYNFIDGNSPNYFALFINWLESKSQCKFIIKSLPIKRLNLAFNAQSNIDFMYPDNSNWHDIADHRIYSQPIALALGGTMVNPQDKALPISQFKKLAVPLGFTPVAWLALQKHYPIEIHETANAKAALLMTIHQRANGADVEYNVAKYLIKNITSLL
jgi:hypothetical protein